MKTDSASRTKGQLTEGSVASHLVKLTVPIIWGVFTVNTFNLVDTYFVGQLGTSELAAMSFTFPVVMTLESLALGLGIGASSLIARAIGQGDRQLVRRLTTDSLTLSLLIVGIFIILGLATIDPLFSALGAGPEIRPLVRNYMSIWYPGMIFLVIPMVGNGAIRATGNTTITSVIITVAAVTNIVLDPLFVFGLFGFPRLELQGAAIATVLGRATTLGASLFVLHRQGMLCFNLPKPTEMLNSWRNILYIALPAGGTNTIAPVSIGLITSLLAFYGPETVAGFGVASRVESFSLIVLMALSAVIGPFVGQNWGAMKYDRVKESLRLSFLFCLFWGMLATVVLAPTAGAIASVFDPDPEVVAIASKYLLVVPISYAGAGALLIASATFNALGKPLPSVIMTITRTFILYVPLAYLGSKLFGVNGIFAAACFANIAVGIGAYLWNQKTCSVKAQLQSESSWAE